MKTRHLHELWITKASLLGYTIESFGPVLSLSKHGFPYKTQKFVLLDQNQHYVCNKTPGGPGYLAPTKFDHPWQAAEYALKLQGIDPYEENLQ